MNDKTILIRQRNGAMGRFSFSGDGRIVTASIHGSISAPPLFESIRYDRIKGHLGGDGADPSAALSFDGEFGVIGDNLGTNQGKVFLLDYDADNDQMDDVWETAFGLDPAVADGGLDKDGDGITNLAEHEAGTHPNGLVKRYLAEGAVNAFFTTRIALFNPNDQPEIVLAALPGHERPAVARTSSRWLRKSARPSMLTATANVPENDFSTVIESDRTVVVDRTMTWDATTYGAHAETALEAPATTWYLAEGATHGAFSLFYLLQNPNDTRRGR